MIPYDWFLCFILSIYRVVFVFDEKPLLPFPLVGFAVDSGREYDQLLIKLGNKEILQLPDT